MLLFTLLICVSFLTLVNYWKNIEYTKLYNKLKPGLKAYPIIGHSYLFFGCNEDRMNGIQTMGRLAMDKGIIAGWFANKVYTVISDPAIAEVVLKHCSEKDFTMKFLKGVLGNGTIIAPVPVWRVRRKILISSFSVKNLNGFVDVFSKQTKVMVDQLKMVGSKPFCIFKYLVPCSMDVAYECTLGTSIGVQNCKEKLVIQAWDALRDHVTNRALSPWLHPDIIYNLLPSASKIDKVKTFLHGINEEAVNEKIKELNDSKMNPVNDNLANKQSPFRAFLDDIAKTSLKIGGYKKSELLEESLVLTFAASDSTAVGASFTCLMLAQHPEVQDKVYEEIKEVFGDDSTKPITPEDLQRLRYLEAVIKESLRLYPPVPFIIREVLEDFTLPSGVTLRKGIGSMVNIWAIHRNPRYWGDDAEVFRPERFLDSTLEHPAQFIAFSYGPRNCVGPQFAMTLMKTMISSMLRMFKLLPSGDPLRLKFEITLKAVNGFLVRLEPRVSNTSV